MTAQNKLLHHKLWHSVQIPIQFSAVGDSLKIQNTWKSWRKFDVINFKLYLFYL